MAGGSPLRRIRPLHLHYLHDPLCGWCYGAAPLLRAARALLPVTAHGGGMMSGARRQPVTAQLRAYVLPHDRRIAALTGQAFGAAYCDGLLCDPQAVFDSDPPIAAMLAADRLAGAGLDLLARLQVAHYVEGRRIAEPEVLAELAAQIGLDRDAFERALAQAQGEPTRAHIEQSRALLERVGGLGFPSFVLQRSERFDLLDHSACLGQPQIWQHLLRQACGLGADADAG
jgi:putative protein-disulfide isomerase